MSTPVSRSSQRYSSNKGGVSGKVVAVIAVLLVAAFLFVGVRALSDRFNRPVTADFISQEHIDNSTGRLWIDVTRKDPSVPSYCIVTAVDYSHAEVGRREVIFPAGGEKHERVAVEMPLRAPLVSGRVYGCSDKLPFYMDADSDFYQAR